MVYKSNCVIWFFDLLMYRDFWTCAFIDYCRYELIKMNHFKGLSLSIVQMFSKQVICMSQCVQAFVSSVSFISCSWFTRHTFFMLIFQILHALVVMKDAGIIHCDLKPENILISTRWTVSCNNWKLFFGYSAFIEPSFLLNVNTSVKPTEIKVIDFGSACMEGRTVYSYIQVSVIIYNIIVL